MKDLIRRAASWQGWGIWCGWVIAVLLPVTVPFLPLAAAQTDAAPAASGSSTSLPTSARQWLDRGLQQLRAKQFETARQSLQEALMLYRQQQDRQGELWSLEGLGRAYSGLGEYEQAAQQYQQHLIQSREIGNSLYEANALANLANIDRVLGHYASAIDRYQQSLAIRQALPNRNGEVQVRANLGNVYVLLGEYEKATDQHQRSFRRAKKRGNIRAMANSLNSLGAIQAEQGNYDAAVQYYERTLVLARELRDRTLEAKLFNNLGSAAHAQKKFDDALRHYRQGFQIARKIESSELEGTFLIGIGTIYALQGNRDRAIQLQEASLAIARRFNDRHQEIIALINLGYTFWEADDLAAAEKVLKQAANVAESLRVDLDDSAKVSIFDTQNQLYSLLQQVLVAQNRPEAALEVAERSRARAFVELLAQRQAAQSERQTSHSDRIDRLPPFPSNISPPNIEQIRQIAREQNATLVEYSVIPDEDFIAQGKLKGSDSQLFIWAIQPSGQIDFRQVELTKLTKPANPLSPKILIASSRDAIGVRSRGLGIVSNQVSARQQPQPQHNQRRQQQTMRRLHSLLIQPIADLLPADPAARVIFLPHDSLFLVPFAALQDSAGQYLIEQHTILTAPSIQLLDLTHKRRQQLSNQTEENQTEENQTEENQTEENQTEENGREDILIVGNPTMPEIPFEVGQAPQPLVSLPGTEQEAKAIARLFQTEALLGNAASETEIKQRLSAARLVHLATHGFLDNFNNEDMPGAIALAPSDQDDGLLTASELVALSLQAELVVLSACDTGRGDITGDGVIGLSRALIAAGSPSALVSLWAVPDAPTAELMTDFYQHLQHTPDKAQALRQAMLAALERHPNIRDWAAFTLIGEAE